MLLFLKEGDFLIWFLFIANTKNVLSHAAKKKTEYTVHDKKP